MMTMAITVMMTMKLMMTMTIIITLLFQQPSEAILQLGLASTSPTLTIQPILSM